MKRIEITLKAIDDAEQVIQQRSIFKLEAMDSHMTGEPLIALAASNEAKKFWESVVLMGYLEKN